MKTLLPNYFYCKSAILQRMVLLLPLLICFNLHAQEEKNVKLALEVGILPLPSGSDNLAFFFNFEPKIKVLEHVFLGLRLGFTLNSNTFENADPFQFTIGEEFDHGVLSFAPTIDYYLNKFAWKEKSFQPYLGLGAGYHLMSGIDLTQTTAAIPSGEKFELLVKRRIGLLLRGGVELGMLRLGIEYSFIPKGDINIPDGTNAGTVDNSYLGLSVGLVINSGSREVQAITE